MIHRPSTLLRRRIVRQVQAVFHDRARGEAPVVRSTGALYPPGSVIWRVHGDVTTMMIGGVTALLLQMLHPAALAGVWDHSTFRDDMAGRLRRTARFIAVTTYGARDDALAAIDRVRRVHEHVRGTAPDGTTYAASDPALLAWVHLCEAVAFLDAWIAFGEPGMSRADQDAYFAEAAVVARALGADPVPETRAAAEALLAEFRPALVVDARTREVARLILDQPAPSSAMQAVQALVMQAAVAILPRWARTMHELPAPPFAGLPLRAGAFTAASVLRWAFATRAAARQT